MAYIGFITAIILALGCALGGGLLLLASAYTEDKSPIAPGLVLCAFSAWLVYWITMNAPVHIILVL